MTPTRLCKKEKEWNRNWSNERLFIGQENLDTRNVWRISTSSSLLDGSMASQEIILEPMEEKETISCLIHCTFGLTENQIVTWRLGFNRVIAAICRYQLLSSPVLIHTASKHLIPNRCFYELWSAIALPQKTTSTSSVSNRTEAPPNMKVLNSGGKAWVLPLEMSVL